MITIKWGYVVGEFMCRVPPIPVRSILRNNLKGIDYFKVLLYNLRNVPVRFTQVRCEVIWLTDDWSDNYFHWQFDILPRLIQCRNKSHIRKVLLTDRVARNPYVNESIALLGFESVVLPRGTLGLVRSAVSLPSMSYFDIGALVELRTVVISSLARTVTNRRRLYISRANAGRRSLTNEGMLLSMLESFGFQSIQAEQMAWVDQVTLFSTAEIVVGVHGAGLSNAVYAPNLKLLIELRPPWQENDLYKLLCGSLNIRYASAPLQASHKEMHGKGFEVTPSSIDSIESIMHSLEK